MAERIASIQGKDGLWRSGLLDPDAYDLPEVSGSMFYTYSLAWGINYGVLNRAKYTPVVTRAWAGILQNIYLDGLWPGVDSADRRAAREVQAFSASYVYGVRRLSARGIRGGCAMAKR